MSQWPSVKAKRLLAALLKIGWQVQRQNGTSHKVLLRPGWAPYTISFHDGEEVGPRMLSKVAKKTGLIPDDL